MQKQDKKLRDRTSNYGLGEIVKNAMSVIWNKIWFPSVRLIRYPVIIRGKNILIGGKI